MMMKISAMEGFMKQSLTRKFAVAVLALGLTAGMATPAKADKEFLGLLGGALGGGVIGHQFGQGKGNTWATAIGAVTGAVVGQSVGASLDRADRGAYRSSYTTTSYYNSAPPVYYNQPAPQRVYYVAPSYERRVRTYEVVPQPTSYTVVDNSLSSQTAGRYCREYNQNVTVGGRTQGSYGTACMQPDGSWEIVK